MRWFILLVAVLISTSCVHTSVRRIDRHERRIVITGISSRSIGSMYAHLKRRGRLLGCRKLIVKQLVKGKVVAICRGRL